MQHEILPNGDLRISVTPDEQQVLREVRDEDPEAFGSDRMMADVFEPLICNSELDWILPEEVGALTSAPLLAILGEPHQMVQCEETRALASRLVGRWENDQGELVDWSQDVERVWGYMDYALRGPQEVLAAQGATVCQAG